MYIYSNKHSQLKYLHFVVYIMGRHKTLRETTAPEVHIQDKAPRIHFCVRSYIRVPTQPGIPRKMRVYLENLELSWNFVKMIIKILGKLYETWKNWAGNKYLTFCFLPNLLNSPNRPERKHLVWHFEKINLNSRKDKFLFKQTLLNL